MDRYCNTDSGVSADSRVVVPGGSLPGDRGAHRPRTLSIPFGSQAPDASDSFVARITRQRRNPSAYQTGSGAFGCLPNLPQRPPKRAVNQ